METAPQFSQFSIRLQFALLRLYASMYALRVARFRLNQSKGLLIDE